MNERTDKLVQVLYFLLDPMIRALTRLSHEPVVNVIGCSHTAHFLEPLSKTT
jgi:hypothetical protein